MPSKEQLRAVQSVLVNRATMRPIRVSNPALQQRAGTSQVFTLQRTDPDHYYFLPTEPGAPVPPADGMFVYVIPASDPGRIYCGAPQGAAAGRDRRFGVQGHTSLLGRVDVLFAGEIQFDHGELLSWSNESGHYSPPAALRARNLIPAVARLLPEGRFIDIATMPMDQARQRLEARGYIFMA